MAPLSFKTKFGYGVGHVLNDLCSAMWFSYLLLYFHHVLLFPNTLAGLILLIGQVADALSTPFVGHEADRVDDLPICAKYGRRKTWHLVGTLCVVLTFAFIFLGCLGCRFGSSAWIQVIYFAPFVIVFQFGWACTQISHLAILPHLTFDPNDRTELNAIRYAFTVISTITVYCITWLILGLTATNPMDVLGPKDATKFVTIVFIVLGIGCFFSLIFHILIREGNATHLPLVNEDERQVAICGFMTWKDWLKEPQFYQVGVLYMATRLFCNLTQVYIPIYLEDTLFLDEKSIAYIPLVMYISGFATATIMRPVNRLAGRKITFLIGCALGGSGALWVLFGIGDLFLRYYLYVVAFLLGSGGSTMLVTVLSIAADMIGSNVECGAFVYGSLSFADKLSNGLVVMLIQYLTPCLTCCTWCKEYFRNVVGYACGGAVLLSVLALLSLMSTTIGQKRFHRDIQDFTPVDTSNTPTPDSIQKDNENDDDDDGTSSWDSSGRGQTSTRPRAYSRLSQSEEGEPHLTRRNSMDVRGNTCPVVS